MKRLSYLLTALATIAVFAGCDPPEEGTVSTEAAAAVEEIPVTTTSEEALALFTEGQHALDMGRFQDADALFKQAAESDTLFTYAYINLMNTAASADEFMRNLEAAEANMGAASEGEQLLVKFNRTFVDVDVGQRRALAEQLVEAYRASPRAWLTLAGVQAGLQEIEAARTSMNKALELDQNFAPTHINLGVSYLFNEPKDFAKAEEHMQRVVELEPNEANAHVNLGDAYRAQQLLEKARDAYGKGAEVDPSSALALSKKGHADSFLGNYDEARTDFDQAVEVARDQVKASYAAFKAYVHAYAGDAEAAVEELGQLYGSIEEMDIPEDQLLGAKITVLTDQAMIAMHHGRFDVAEEAIRSQTEYIKTLAEGVGDEDFTQSQEANIAFWEGLLAAYKGEFDTARAKAEENARLVEPQTDPTKMQGYHRLLGLIELKSGNPQGAVEHYQQANPNAIMVKYHHALALEGTGNQDEASRLFKEVAEWNFNSAAYACVRNDAIQKVEAAM